MKKLENIWKIKSASFLHNKWSINKRWKFIKGKSYITRSGEGFCISIVSIASTKEHYILIDELSFRLEKTSNWLTISAAAPRYLGAQLPHTTAAA